MYKPLPNHTNNFDDLKPFSEIRLLAVDLDGTLLRSNESLLPKKVLELARKLNYHKQDVRFTIATGRTLSGARSLLDRLPIRKDTPIILYNGSVITNIKYEVLRLFVIDSLSFRDVVDACRKYGVKTIAYSYGWLVQDQPKEEAFGWSSFDKPDIDYNKMVVKWLDWDCPTNDISASAVVIHTNGDVDITKCLTADLERIKGIRISHGSTYIEVGPKEGGKGNALQYAAELLSLKREQVLAIGDNDNDAEMLAWAGIGVGVESASTLALKNIDYISKRGVMSGAIEVLMLVHFARRYAI